MKEIFLVDRNSRLDSVLSEAYAEEAQNGLSSSAGEDTLGLGFFSCRPDAESNQKGVSLFVTPASLRQELLNEILAGRFSPLSQDVILYGGPNGAPDTRGEALSVKRWLLTGLQPVDELSLQRVPFADLTQRLLRTQDLAGGVGELFSELLRRIEGLFAKRLVVPLDSRVLVDFFYSLYGPVPFGLSLGNSSVNNSDTLTPIEREVCAHRVSEEVIRWLSQFDKKIQSVIVCPSRKQLQGLIATCRDIKTSANPTEVQFRI